MDRESSLGDILGSLMQDPEIMKKVSEAAKSFGAAPDAKNENEEEKSEKPDGISIPPELLAKLPSIMSSFSHSTPLASADNSSHGSGSDKKRKELLRALKPFLSEKRCTVIDSLLQIEGLAGLLGTRGGK